MSDPSGDDFFDALAAPDGADAARPPAVAAFGALLRRDAAFRRAFLEEPEAGPATQAELRSGERALWRLRSERVQQAGNLPIPRATASSWGAAWLWGFGHRPGAVSHQAAAEASTVRAWSNDRPGPALGAPALMAWQLQAAGWSWQGGLVPKAVLAPWLRLAGMAQFLGHGSQPVRDPVRASDAILVSFATQPASLQQASGACAGKASSGLVKQSIRVGAVAAALVVVLAYASGPSGWSSWLQALPRAGWLVGDRQR